MKIHNHLLALALALASTPLAAQGVASSPASPTAQVSAGALVSGSYVQSSSNPLLGASETASAVPMQGQQARVALTAANMRLDVALTDYKAKGSAFLSSRRETSFGLGYVFASVPWLVPDAGLYQAAAAGDRNRADAPAAFIDKTSTFRLGARAEFVPLGVDGHGLVLRLAYHYLTSGEAKNNFGDDRLLEAGYLYKDGTLEAGVTFGVARTFLNASREATKTAADGSRAVGRDGVRSTLTGNVVSLFLGY